MIASLTSDAHSSAFFGTADTAQSASGCSAPERASGIFAAAFSTTLGSVLMTVSETTADTSCALELASDALSVTLDTTDLDAALGASEIGSLVSLKTFWPIFTAGAGAYLMAKSLLES